MLKSILRQVLFSALFALSCSFTQPAHAWGDLGHQTVGEIAERLLAPDEATMGAVRAVTGVEPFFISATWPDQARNDKRFNDFAAYHFFTIYRDHDKTDDKSAAVVLEKYPALLIDPKVPREAKMLALRYIIHVVGDVHQPLHIGNEFDIGGNVCKVKWQPQPESKPLVTNLHTVWDDQLVDRLAKKIGATTTRRGEYRDLATYLIKKYPSIVSSKQNTDFKLWTKESHLLMKTVGYPDYLPEESRPYCNKKGLVADDLAPILDGNFADTREKIVEQRLILAGVRLAAFIKQTFRQPMEGPQGNQQENQVLEVLRLNR